ncbi:MbtH family NRPS accessory protein [Micromonospora sp. NPDC002717]|uniref:MbtH family NRPS accessory protein n=1 Tax=Micromonospora sp. NPDC002717 TaxID=3154424 RepID=UPI00331652C9
MPRYEVVVNDLGQYSTWPADREPPAGWWQVAAPRQTVGDRRGGGPPVRRGRQAGTRASSICSVRSGRRPAAQFRRKS